MPFIDISKSELSKFKQIMILFRAFTSSRVRRMPNEVFIIPRKQLMISFWHCTDISSLPKLLASASDSRTIPSLSINCSSHILWLLLMTIFNCRAKSRKAFPFEVPNLRSQNSGVVVDLRPTCFLCRSNSD